MKKTIIIILVILIGYVVLSNRQPVFAWIQSVVGDIHSETGFDAGSPSTYFSLASGSNMSGIITVNGAASGLSTPPFWASQSDPSTTANQWVVNVGAVGGAAIKNAVEQGGFYQHYFNAFPTVSNFAPANLAGSNITSCTSGICVTNRANFDVNNEADIPSGSTYVLFIANPAPPDGFVVDDNIDLDADGDLAIDDGNLFIVVVNGNMTIQDPTTHIDGIYIVSGNVVSNVTNPLTVNGMIIAQGTITLNGSGASPSERFVYYPSFLTLIPPQLRETRQQAVRMEVAP